MKRNFIIETDSYKVSQYKQYPPDTKEVYSYFESRGGKFRNTVFFGLQYYIKRYLADVKITKEGMEISTDIGINYEVDPTKVPVLFSKYRLGLEEITAGPLRGILRDAFNIQASTVDVEFAYGEGRGKLLDSVEQYCKRYFEPYGIKINKVYYVGSFRLPSAITTALNKKVEAKTIALQLENEVAQTQAQAKKNVEQARGDSMALVIRAAGEATAFRIKAAALTENYVRYETIMKWNGALPTVTSGTPLIKLDGMK